MQSVVRVTYSKAIGIILMVLGHCSCSVPYVTLVIYMFHMPLFFFILDHIQLMQRLSF